MPKNNKAYKEEPWEQSGEEVVREARAAIKEILRLKIESPLKQKIIDPLLWAITEAHGKYRLRYRSAGVVHDDLSNPKSLIHEHVFTRSSLRRRLLEIVKDEFADAVLDDVIACTVTEDEHDTLKKMDGEGWVRYKKARVRVYDCRVVPFVEKELPS